MVHGETDLFRDTKVRYLGYANEVGETIRSFVSKKVVRASYAVATGYVICDTVDKSIKMMRHDGRLWKVAAATGDALIWQGLASIVIPGFAVNRICFHTFRYLKKTSYNGTKMQHAITTGVGLGSIPIIITPIDRGVDFLMNISYRLVFGT
ncbi:unnamed protein product [Plutella xylostella]|uniref:Mitochondrial fission process protein 1 n=1 Tax=Plutella xylostella TaxID=51655 RepID=A0A8S4FEW7_PLUXY|nr:mitochondrial fission process protein 1 [Plutella xylostella]CAG9126345.1 unnamed protein product [Plutella xylostella]